MALKVLGVIVPPVPRAKSAAVPGVGGNGPTNGVRPVPLPTPGVSPVRGVSPVLGVRPVRKDEGSKSGLLAA